MQREREKQFRRGAMCTLCLATVSTRSAHVSVTCQRCCSDLIEHYAEGLAAALLDRRARDAARPSPGPLIEDLA